MGFLDEVYGGTTEAPGAPKSSLARRLIADPALSLVKGAISVPEAALGIADIATGGWAGQAAESAGFRPKEARGILDDLYTPEQQKLNREVAEAEGFIPTIASAVERPSVIAHTVLESAPGMIGAGGVARSLLKKAPKVMATAGEMAPTVAGALGEGTFGAGSAAEQIRQASDTGTLTPGQTGISVLSGLGTAAFGLGGGTLARKLGIADVETMIASGNIAGQGKAGLLKGVAGGMLSEGMFEELPQSAQEQVMQNLAQGRPWDEGVAKSAAMGALAGAAMGGGGQVLSKTADALAPKPTILQEIQGKREAGDIEDATLTGGDVLQDSGGFLSEVNAVPAAANPLPPTMIPTLPEAPKGALTRAVEAGGLSIADIAPETQPTELDRASQWAMEQIKAGGNGHLMQGPRMSNPAYSEYLVSEYRKAQAASPSTFNLQPSTGVSDAVTNLLPDLQGAGPGQVDGAGLAVPAVQGQVAGGTGDNSPSAARIAELQQEKERLIAASDQGITGGLTHTPEVTKRLNEINNEIRYLKVADATLGGPPTPIDAQAHDAATSPTNDTPEPTQAQIEAGNYKKGHVNVHGLDISVENPAGSMRKGVDENGKAWETKLAHHYGYIKGTVGKDKDHIDVFIGPQPESAKVFVVDQVDPKTEKLDEHKVMLGFDSLDAARSGYLANYDKSGPQRIGSVTETTIDGFKQWLDKGSQNKPFVSPSSFNPQPSTVSQKHAERRKLNAAKDSLPAAIAKLGGISLAEMEQQYGNARELSHILNKIASKEAATLLHVISSKGKSLDRIREALVEQGYLPESATINDLLDRLDSASRGTVYRSTFSDNAGTDEYQAQMDRYAAMVEDMSDEEYAEFSRNQWLDEQADLLAEANDLLDGFIGELQAGEQDLTAADWQAIVNDFKEALDATEFNAGSDAETQGPQQTPAAGRTEGVSEVVRGDTDKQTAAGHREKWTATRSRHLTKKIAEAKSPKERERLQKILAGLKQAVEIKPTADFSNIPMWNKPLSKIKEGDEARISAADAQTLANVAGDGYLYRVTSARFFDSGLDSGNPEYGHKFEGNEEATRGITSFGVNDTDRLVLIKLDNETPETIDDMVLYKVRPADIGGEFIAIRRDNDIIHLYSDTPVDTTKAEAVLKNDELVSHYDALRKKEEGTIHEIDLDRNEIDTILAELGAAEPAQTPEAVVPGIPEAKKQPALETSAEGSPDQDKQLADKSGKRGDTRAVSEDQTSLFPAPSVPGKETPPKTTASTDYEVKINPPQYTAGLFQAFVPGKKGSGSGVAYGADKEPLTAAGATEEEARQRLEEKIDRARAAAKQLPPKKQLQVLVAQHYNDKSGRFIGPDKTTASLMDLESIKDYAEKHGLPVPPMVLGGISEATRIIAEQDREIIARHKTAAEIEPIAKAVDEPLDIKGTKKLTEELEKTRKELKRDLSQREDLMTRGSAAVSNYDKRLGYDLDYNLKLNENHIIYGKTQIARLEKALNPSTPSPPSKKSKPALPASYGADNKLVTADRAAEIRAKLRAKFDNQVNSGIDPEMLAMGTELAIFHIEAGVRKFADFARAISEDLGVPVKRLREYLRGWYNGARDTIEDKGLSIEGMDDSAVVREAHKALFEESKPAPKKLGFHTVQSKDRHFNMLKRLATEAKTEQGRASWMKKLETYRQKLEKEQPAAEAAAEIPENWQHLDTKPEPTFKKGDRIQTADGQHGAISEARSYTVSTGVIDITGAGVGVTKRSVEHRHMYTGKMDNGVEQSLYAFQPETDPAPQVVPAPVVNGKAVDPQRLLDDIKNDKDSAANKRAAASRAKKASSIREHTESAEMYARKAVDKQAAFDAWALEHPAEAIKYQKTAEIVAVPPVSDSTGTEKAPAAKLKMEIKETVHTKKGHKLFIVKMFDRVERDEYDKLNRDAKRTGNGWDKWSKGFQFLDRESAESFMEKWSGVKPEPAPAAKGPKVEYHTFMQDVYHTLEENGMLQENARSVDRDEFVRNYKDSYLVAVRAEKELHEKRGEDVAETAASAMKNELADLADKYFDRAREKKPAPAELTNQQQSTIATLGPVGTQVESIHNRGTLYTISEIQPDGKLTLDGGKWENIDPDLFESVAESALASPADSSIMVNEKAPTQEGPTDAELRGYVENTAADGEPAGTGTARTGGTSGRNPAGGRGSVQPTGKRSGKTDDGRPAQRPTVSGKSAETEPGRNDSQGDNGKRRDGVLEVMPLNFRITDEHGIGKGGAKQKARDNIAAIKLLQQITAEEREATPDEQAVLVKYVDWGMSELANNIFDNSGQNPATRRWENSWYKEGWEDLGAELKSLLTAEEYAAAKKSTMSAFYTPIPIYQGMHAAAEQMGFTGGRILVPGSGLLHEAGTLPDSFLASTRITGVELNPVSAAISKLLYPSHDIRHQGFEKFVMPDGFYDMAFGNPPFVDLDVTSDPAYSRHKFKLHDYFFAKSIDKVRPGGLLMFITSKGTMDKANDKARAYLAERADLLGAIRLPETAFKENAGTETVTDVIFLRKRIKGEEPAGQAWGELKPVKTPDGVAHVNEYFAANPQMVLGKNAIASSQFGPKYTVLPLKGTPLEEQFNFAVRNYLPKDIYTRDKVESPADRPTVEFDLAPSTIKEGAFYLDKDGKVLSKENGVGVPTTKKGKDLEILKSFIPLRDAVRNVLYVQIKGGDLAEAQKELKYRYSLFVRAHGIINSEKRIVTTRNGVESVSVRTPNFSPFRDDPDAYLVASIERYDDSKNTATPGPIFTERTIKPEAIPQINSVHDALHVVMHEDGRVDIGKIAAHMNVSEAQAIDALGTAIYHNPQTMQWETDDEYLSGNVKQKLALAESSAQADPAFERNVEALKAVQPADLPPSRISLGLGEPILKPEHIQQFAKEVINLGIRVSHLKTSGDWGVEKQSGYQTVEATSEWGTPRRPAHELISDALNSRQIRIESYEMRDGKEVKVFDKDATNAANEKLAKIKERFAQWVWENPGRAEELSRDFNDAYNNTVKRVYGGEHINKMTFPGMSAVVTPHEHQKRVAWRIVQSGNTYMAHSVGAGKTIASILAGMELKRLGIKKKPSYVVPNHMLKQFASEFLQLYPAAKIIVADETQFSKENRNRFMGRVAAENWDAVIITHSAFGKMQVSPDFSVQFIQDQIDELEWQLSDTDSSDRLKRKQIERAKARLEQRLEKVLNATDKDKGVTFEETGIDQIFVDEAHEFRKLDFITNQTNIKGIDPNGSLMAFDLYVKSRYLEKLYPGRSLVLMSGTAITNTIGEIFTIQRFLQESKLQELGLDNFDAWSSTFGDLVTKLEATPAGNYKPVTRFAKFKKLSSLSQLWSEVGDFIHARDLTYIKRPSVKSGGRIIVTGELSPAQAAYKKTLAARIKAIEQRKRPPQKGDDILLSVITDGRHAALDERYISHGSKPSKDNKLEKMASNVAEIWTDTKKDKLTQMIFCDLGMPGSEARRGFSAYNQIKESLIKQGIPANEIAFMQDYKKSDEKLKLFRAMNEGTIRVLIGSSEAMGTGVNAQRKLVALHHLDPDTYLPSNIEQREGRIVRQGNDNEEIHLYAYVTKGSYDETMWQFLETKQRFIDQFLSGESTTDEATDVDGGADSFAMARAMSSDNPLILERAGIESDIQRLESLRRAYFDDQMRLKNNVMRAEDNLPHYRKEMEALDRVIARRVDTSGDKFALTVGSSTFDERKKAGESLTKVIDKILTGGVEEEWHKIGEVAGLDIMARGGIALKMPWVNLSVGATGTYSNPISFQGLESTNDLDAVGLSMKLENLARSFDKNLSYAQEQAAKDEKLLRDSKDRIGRPFDHAAALEDKRKRLEEIERILQAEERKSDAGDTTDGPQMSRRAMSDGDVVGITAEKALNAITGLLDKWKNAPAVNVIQTVDDMPEGLRDQMYSLGAADLVRGVYDEGTVYLVASNLRNSLEAVETLLHETVGHYGIRAVVGKNLNIVLSQIAHTADKATMAEIAERYGYDLTDREDLLAAAEEYLADMAQDPQRHPALLARAIAVVRNWLRAMGLELEWTDADIRALLAQAAGYVERGKGGPTLFDGTKLMVAAWHGSNSDHDRFSSEYIDTGEGAQAYGWGLYFAGSREVAEFYRNKLSSWSPTREEMAEYFKPGSIVPSYGGAWDKVISFNEGPELLPWQWSVTVRAVDNNGEFLRGERNRTHFTTPGPGDYKKITGKEPARGKLYYVELAPEEDEYLLWDNSLSEQSEKVKDALKDAFDDITNRETDYHKASMLSKQYQEMLDKEDKASGAYIYKNFAMDLGDAEASAYLHSLGIRGIKYMDGSSRGKGEGNFNYVIFNDADVSIKAKMSLRKTGAGIVAEAQSAYADSSAADMAKGLGRMVNPLDFSRLRQGFERVAPDSIKNALGWFFGTPVGQAERDPNKKVFVDTGIEREENKIGFQLRFMGWDGQAGKESTFWSRFWDNFTTWGESDKSTAWGRIQDANNKLSSADQEAVNVLLVEGDRRSKAYSSLDKALLNPAIKAAKPSEAAFKVYKSVRRHIDTVVANEREKIYTEMSRKAGVDEETIKRHISDYRQSLSERPGWLPRNHGEGKHQVNVYQIVKDLKFETKGVTTEAHGENSTQAYLPYYAGPQATDRLTEIVDRINDKYKDAEREKRIRFGAYINGKALTANGQLIVTGAKEDIAEFLKQAETVIPAVIEANVQRLEDLRKERAVKEKEGASRAELREMDSQIKAASDTRVRVKVFMQLHESQGKAEKVLKGVRSDLRATMPTNYRDGEAYESEYRVADGMSESAYGDLSGDFAMERAQLEAIKRATQSGEISADEAKKLRDKIIQSSAEVLMGRGAGRHQIQRAPYLIEGYETEGAIGMYHDYMTSTAGMLSKAEYAKEQFENFRYAPAAVKPWAEQYIKDSLRNMGLADRISGNARAVACFWYLAFKVSSILVNGTQVWTLGVAELGRRTKQNAVKAIAKAQRDIFKGNLSPDEKDLFHSKLWKLQEMETAVHEISGSGEGVTGRFSDAFHQLTNKAMMPFQEMELLNRKTMILSAYRSGLADGMGKGAAVDFALDVNRKVNFEMSRANLPGWARNPLGRTGYALQSFVWNNWNWIYNRATSGEKADMLALLKYAAMLSAIGGVTALAGGDEADKLLRRFTGKSYKLEMEKWSRTHAREYGTAGELLNATVWHGGMGALGINISNALRLNIPMSGFITGDKGAGESAMGVFSGLWDKGSRAAEFTTQGQYARALESAAPTVIEAPLRAARMATKGATTTHGKPIFDELGRPVKYTAGEAVVRALGFQPLQQSQRTEVAMATGKAVTFWNEKRGDLLDSLRMATTTAERQKVQRDIWKFNEAVQESQAWPKVNIITSKSITQAKQARPDKKKQAALRNNS